MTLNHKILYAFAHTINLCGLASWVWLIYAVNHNQLTENGLGIVLLVSFVGFGLSHLIYNRIWKQVA